MEWDVPIDFDGEAFAQAYNLNGSPMKGRVDFFVNNGKLKLRDGISLTGEVILPRCSAKRNAKKDRTELMQQVANKNNVMLNLLVKAIRRLYTEIAALKRDRNLPVRPFDQHMAELLSEFVEGEPNA